jgi:hypothetical protein
VKAGLTPSASKSCSFPRRSCREFDKCSTPRPAAPLWWTCRINHLTRLGQGEPSNLPDCPLNIFILRPTYGKSGERPKKRNAGRALPKREQFRRVTLLCCHFVRNLAYHRAGKNSSGQLKRAGEFWITVHSNFLDCCVLEWCKLFVDTKNGNPGEHRWDNVVADNVRFEAELFQHINKTQFQALISAMRTARNKFIAHLDDQNVEHTPHMDMAKDAVQFYHGYIVRNEAKPGDLTGAD